MVSDGSTVLKINASFSSFSLSISDFQIQIGQPEINLNLLLSFLD